MKNAPSVVAWMVAVAPAWVGCVQPRPPIALGDIPALPSLHAVMKETGRTAEPLFGKARESALSDADFAAFTDAGARLQATAQRTRDFAPKFKEPQAFVEWANALQTQARALEEAAASKDAEAARRALVALQGACNGCHSRFD